MKNNPILFILITTFFVISGCKKDKEKQPVPVVGTVHFVFNNVVDSQPLTLGNLNYVNEAGNVYGADLLMYYISNISFVKSDNSVFHASNYELIDESKTDSKTFSMQVPYGEYKTLGFYMGVDSIKNVTGAQEGELDPSYGMFWDWNTGYIYFKHEGNFIDVNSDTLPVVYHYGSFDALVVQEHDIEMTVSQTPRTIRINFNLNKLYRSPNVVDFNNNNIHSGGANWVNTLRENFNGAFEVTDIN